MNDNTPTLAQAVQEVADLWREEAPLDRDMTPEAFTSIALAAHEQGDERAGALADALDAYTTGDPGADETLRAGMVKALRAFGQEVY